MKIILAVHCFFPDHVYGTETYTLCLAQHLRALGHESLVLSAVFTGEPGREALVTRYSYEEIPVICIDRNYLSANSLEEFFDQPQLETVYAKLIAEERPDIIHVNHLMNHSCALVRAATSARVALWATLTDFHAFCFNGRLEETGGGLCSGPDRTGVNCLACLGRVATNYGWAGSELRSLRLPESRLLRALRGILIKAGLGSRAHSEAMCGLKQRAVTQLSAYAACRALITPSSFLEKAFRRQAPTLPYVRMSFGVDVDRSPKPPRLAGHRLVFGFIGQLTSHKGPDLLVDAFRQLSPGSAELVIYGSEAQDVDFAAHLRTCCTGLDVTLRGTFPPTQIAEVLAAIDVLVIPSRWHENSPLVLLNALATHTPVIISDAEGMTEFVTAGDNGFIFAMGRRDGLTAALLRFVDRPLLAAEMSARTHYTRTTRHMAEDVVALYQIDMPSVSARP